MLRTKEIIRGLRLKILWAQLYSYSAYTTLTCSPPIKVGGIVVPFMSCNFTIRLARVLASVRVTAFMGGLRMSDMSSLAQRIMGKVCSAIAATGGIIVKHLLCFLCMTSKSILMSLNTAIKNLDSILLFLLLLLLLLCYYNSAQVIYDGNIYCLFSLYSLYFWLYMPELYYIVLVTKKIIAT